MIPLHLKGTEFEALCAEAAERYEKAGVLTMGRYGVTRSFQKNKQTGKMEERAIESLPDFEGAIAPHGKQFIMENKVCSGSSFPMKKDKIKPRQVAHLLRRSRFGALSFLVIHFCSRQLKTANFAAFTVAIPVTDEDPRWQKFIDAHALAKKLKQPVIPQGSISRDEADFIGLRVQWEIAKGCRKARPNLLSFLRPETEEAEVTPIVTPAEPEPEPELDSPFR